MDDIRLGDTVLYHLNEYDRKDIRGNSMNSPCPATVVKVWDQKTLNLKVHTDGENDLWKTSVKPGTNPGDFERR